MEWHHVGRLKKTPEGKYLFTRCLAGRQDMPAGANGREGWDHGFLDRVRMSDVMDGSRYRVRGNDWSRIPPLPDEFEPYLKVSVIVTCYQQAGAELNATLSALLHQTYPRTLMELIVVDDGSDPPLEPERLPAGVRLIRQERDGRGVPRARNNGARAASGDILLFVDGDMVMNPQAVEVHARWHHRSSYILVSGERRFIEPDGADDEFVAALLAGTLDIEYLMPHSRMFYLKATGDLVMGRDDTYGMMLGGNASVLRDNFWSVGAYNEEFRHWGHEDGEFAWRAFNRGMAMVPAPDAWAWHWGGVEGNFTPAKADQKKISYSLMEQLVPQPALHYGGRASAGRTFAVPEYVTSIKSNDPDLLLHTALDVLADPPHDMVVRLDVAADDGSDLALVLRCMFQEDPRVRFAAIDDSLADFPDSPFHVRIETDVALRRGVVQKLRRMLGDQASIGTRSPACQVRMSRARYLHRAEYHQCRLSDVGELGTFDIGKVSAGTPRRVRLFEKAWRYAKRKNILGALRTWAGIRYSTYMFVSDLRNKYLGQWLRFRNSRP